MGAVCIMSWYQTFNGSYVGLPPMFYFTEWLGWVALSSELWSMWTEVPLHQISVQLHLTMTTSLTDLSRTSIRSCIQVMLCTRRGHDTPWQHSQPKRTRNADLSSLRGTDKVNADRWLVRSPCDSMADLSQKKKKKKTLNAFCYTVFQSLWLILRQSSQHKTTNRPIA